jgi:hypothetical protein
VSPAAPNAAGVTALSAVVEAWSAATTSPGLARRLLEVVSELLRAGAPLDVQVCPPLSLCGAERPLAPHTLRPGRI